MFKYILIILCFTTHTFAKISKNRAICENYLEQGFNFYSKTSCNIGSPCESGWIGQYCSTCTTNNACINGICTNGICICNSNTNHQFTNNDILNFTSICRYTCNIDFDCNKCNNNNNDNDDCCIGGECKSNFCICDTQGNGVQCIPYTFWDSTVG